MNDSRQFFSHTNTSNNSTSYGDAPFRRTVNVGDIIQYQIGGTITWTGVIIKTNVHNYLHMAEVQWLNDGHTGTVDVRDCSVIARTL